MSELLFRRREDITGGAADSFDFSRAGGAEDDLPNDEDDDDGGKDGGISFEVVGSSGAFNIFAILFSRI